MTRTVEDMAHEAGLTRDGDLWLSVARFAELVRADERERCARACIDVGAPDPSDPNSTLGEYYRSDVAEECAAAIRALKDAP